MGTVTAMNSVHLKSVLVAFLACLSGPLTMFVAAAPAPMHPTNNKLHGVGLLMAPHSVKSKRSQELEKNPVLNFFPGSHGEEGKRCGWFGLSFEAEYYDCAPGLDCRKDRCREPGCECAVM